MMPSSFGDEPCGAESSLGHSPAMSRLAELRRTAKREYGARFIWQSFVSQSASSKIT
jgi:hypothetical protein